MKLIYNTDDLIQEHYSRRYSGMENKTDLMLGCADSDVQIPSFMQEDVIKFVRKGNFSYTYWTDRLLQAVNLWYRWKYNLIFSENEFIHANGVIHLMQIALEVLTNPSNGIIIQPPVYGSFAEIIKNKKRTVVKNNLIYNKQSQSYEIDFDDLEDKMKNSNNKVLLLCNPHNPVGRVWTKNELEKICSLSLKYNVFIIVDEIWQDIVFKDYVHIPGISIIPDAQNIITISSQGKTYNTGAAQFGFALSHNKKLIELMKKTLSASIEYASTNALSANMFISGYTNVKNRAWLKVYVNEIENKYNLFKSKIEKHTKIKVTNAEGLYLVWVDFTDVVKNKEELQYKLQKLGIYGNYFDSFCLDKPELFVRFVIEIPKKNLESLINRIILNFK